MMQNQESEGSSSLSENNVCNEAPQTAYVENVQLITNFDNIEDILDFSLHSPTEVLNSNGDKKRPPRRLCKMVAQEPVKLLELKPIIDQFVDDEHKNLEDDVDNETETKSRRFQCIILFVEVNLYDLLTCIVICVFIQEPNRMLVLFAGNDFQGVTT